MLRALPFIAVLFQALSLAADAKGTPPMQPLPRPISITAADCISHGFPPLDIHFDLTCAGLLHFLFPGKDTLVSMSGPPGGPCHFSIRLVRAENGTLPTLESLVKAHDLPKQNFALLGSGKLDVLGQKRDALCYVVKPTPWADHCASVLVTQSDNHTALLLTFSAAYDKKHRRHAWPLAADRSEVVEDRGEEINHTMATFSEIYTQHYLKSP